MLQNNNNLPDYARVVLVPVANPQTAPELLALGAALVDPEEGRIIALIVSLGEAESEAKSIAAMEPIIAELQEAGNPIELKTEIATSISRGILDVARELGADLLIIGLHQPTRGQVVLGTVVENVIETSPCDVLVYRAAHKPDFSRVVVPVDGTMHGRVACHTGIRLAQKFDARIEAMHVQRVGNFYADGLARIEWSLNGIPGQEKVRRTVVTAQDLAQGLLTRVTEDDLIVVGFSERSNFERWLFGNLSRKVLDHAPGPVILTVRSAGQSKFVGRMRRRLGWVRPTLTRVEQDEIVRQSQEMAAPNLDYFVLILIAAVIASLGLLLNSAAVIIGAMLVAPLMQPLTAFATGLALGQFVLTRRAILTLFQGILVALLVAAFIGRLFPTDTPTTEMLARGNPTLLDAAVALASGFIAAYATARKDIPAALAGVAIAAALMPPLCTVGLGIAFRDAELGLGAGLLFLANILCIIVAGWLVFFWLGMRPQQPDDSANRVHVFHSVLLVVAILLVVFAILLNLSQEANRRKAAADSLQALLPYAELVNLDFVSSSHPLRVVATVRSTKTIPTADLQAAQDALAAELGELVQLEVVFMHVLTLPSASQ